jgi:hypothetical protein
MYDPYLCIIECMRLYFMTALAASLLIPVSAQISGIKNVYVMPMSGGLDQYLALRITEGAVLQVVTDPQKADAVLTDRIGGHFEETFQDLFASRTPESSKTSEKGKPDAPVVEFAHPGMQPLTTGRGAIFLVDRATRNVLWSTYELPKNSTPEELNRSAQRIADRLSKPQKKGKQ